MSKIIKTDQYIALCPFCGSTAHLDKASVWTHDAFKVVCDKCKNQTQFEVVGTAPIYGEHKGEIMTETEAIKTVIDLWNTRILA